MCYHMCMSQRITIDKADKVFSQYIRLRDGQCLRCGSGVSYNAKGLPVSHQASHFKGRRKENTRFNPDNVCTLCHGCHMYFTAQPDEHYEWQIKRLGQDKVNELILWSNVYCKKDRGAQYLIWKSELELLLSQKSLR